MPRTADPIADSEQRQELRAMLRRLIDEVSPTSRVLELDDAEQFDDQLFDALAEVGVWGLGVAEEHGGLGDIREQLLALEELAAGPTSMAVYGVVHYMLTHIVGRFGSGEQRDRWLEGLVTGRSKGSFALTEPGGGTDVAAAMATRARPVDGGGWVINGQKTWISGATRADVLVVLARTEQSEVSVDGISMFLVPADTPGIEVRELDTFAVHSLDTCEIYFQDVQVGPDALVGEAGRGFRTVLSTLNRERLAAAAGSLGAARGAWEATRQYAEERHAFGKPIGAFQAIQHRLVDGATSIEAARGLIARAAALEAAGERADTLSAMAKIVASEAATKVTEDGMQAFGGAGFSREVPMQRWFRDVRLWTFSPLTNEMLRNYLGERLLGLPRSF